MATEGIQDHLERLLGAVDGGRLRDDGLFDALLQDVREAIEQGEEDGLLVWEVEIDAALGGLGLLGDVVDQRAVVALAGEDAGGGVEDALIPLLGAELLCR